MRLFSNLFWLLVLTLHFFGGTVSFASSTHDNLLARVKQEGQLNEEKVAAALAAMETVQQTGAYIDAISDLFEDGVVTLPVGIRKGEYELIIRELSYNKETDKNRVLASCAFRFKDDGQAVAFEGYVDVEGQKGLGTTGMLELVTPVSRRMGSELALVFNEGTRVNFGCEGVESFYANMVLLVDSAKIKPVDALGKPTGGMLRADFEGYFEDFDNFSVDFDFAQSFGFAGLDGFVFTLHGATLDQSDVFTPTTARFPDGYGVQEEEALRNLWKGIAISSASVTLPNATPWYVNQVKPLIYGNADVLKATAMVGLLPKATPDVVKVSSNSKTNTLTDELLKSNSRASNISKFAAFSNNAPYHINKDYNALRTILANTIVASKLRTDKVASFLATNNIPDQIPGDYGLELRYVLPGKGTVTSSIKSIIKVE